MAAIPDYVPAHQVGDTIEGGKYRLDALLGVGSFGEVWRAMHVAMSKVVAIKILHWRITKPEIRSRFAQEARVAIDLAKHNNIVAGRDLIVEGDTLAIVMEYIDGGMTLRSFMEEWTPSTREALRITAAMLEGLMFAHENGVLHRDMKPENVLLNPRTDPPTPMITDFGLAGTSHGTEGDDRMTKMGTHMGTPGYLAFEQWTSATLATARSDLYSVGVMLGEMLGVAPIATDIKNISDSVNSKKRDEWLEKIPNDRLRKIVNRATAIEFLDGRVQEHRYPSARAMLADVLEAMKEFPQNDIRVTPRPQPPRPVILASASPVTIAPPDVRGPLYTEVGGDDDAAVEAAAPSSSDPFEDPEPTPRKWPWGWIIGAVAAALIGIGVVALWPEAETPIAEVVVKTPAEPTPDTPLPTPEVKATVKTPAAEVVPVIEPTMERKPEVKTEVKAEVKPMAEVKPVIKSEPVKVEPSKTEDPKPEPVTTSKVTITNPTASAKVGDAITVNVSVALLEGKTRASTTLRWKGESGGWQSKSMTNDSGTITVNAAMGTKLEYYVDVRTTDDPGRPIKSNGGVPVTVNITH